MSLGIVLLALAAIALIYVLVPVAASAGWRWHRPWRLTCPRAGRVAQIRVGAVRAAVAEVLGRQTEIERCSLWPAVRNCRQECLALSMTAQQQMRRGEAPPRERTEADFRTILVPLDGRPGSEAVLPAVAELARARGLAIRLLRVVAPVTEVRADDDRIVVYANEESSRVDTEAREYLERAAGALGGIAVEQAVRVDGGDVVVQIVEEAEAAGVDLIAMAAHRRHRLARLLRGSVADRLEQATTIPLLRVPYAQDAAA